ncbi:hypothetical protein Cgig2_010058 [Carnegiea gigantea]|uniref:Small ribosomal subunit protein uS7 domain-containing protein n=1 Tax=Carnegiea gigantea TaxID=171969 RepID=A0A9Q1QBM9_9CARY|nr:hypothetical protein Cgig2_010058 [Carnegiea gigantea]
MVDAVENIKPICKVEKVRVAGTIYDVPGIVARDRQQTLAIRWILEAAFKRRINYRISLEKCSFDEILDAYRKRGIARKKRENLHGLASANRSFAHFRWCSAGRRPRKGQRANKKDLPLTLRCADQQRAASHELVRDRGEETPVSDTEMVESEFLRLD